MESIRTESMTRAALGVERSMLGRRWRPRLDDAAELQALAIGQVHGLPDLLSRILAGRRQTVSTCREFLEPSLRHAMPDPDHLSGMAEAVERLVHAVQRKERVAIFGDYDVDGACAAVLLAEYLQAAGVPAVIHIPDRITEGYGPNVTAIQALREGGARLLVTVDCGTTSGEALAHARRLGLDVVVIDHHGASADLPEVVALVNPNRQDDLSGLGHLCAAGVVYMVLVGLHRALRQAGTWASAASAPDLLAGLDLVALATVADVVPLTGLNRAFVAKGLAVMRQRQRPGLAALADVAGTRGPVTAFHLGFLLGPRINAGGRIGRAGLGADLLMTRDPLQARGLAETLDTLNRERRSIEASALEEAEATALAHLADRACDRAVVMAHGEGWHPGVVGLVAARLRERHERPAFAIAMAKGLGTGSGRSVPGVDLGRIVRAAVEAGLLLKGGGHAMAAGITIAQDRLEAFGGFVHDHCGAAVASARKAATIEIDALLAVPAVAAETVALVERAGPFGTSNPEPVFAMSGHRVLSVMPVGSDHLRVVTQGREGPRVSAMAFRAARTDFGARLSAAEGRTVHLAGHLGLSRWGGPGQPEIRLVDAAAVDDLHAC